MSSPSAPTGRSRWWAQRGTSSGAGKPTSSCSLRAAGGGLLSETATLRASDGQPGDRFGEVALSADGQTVVVGASEHFGLAGAVYVFTQPAGGWAGTLSESYRLLAPT
ncbi:MAG: FG-GAP repeat protein, partial [Ardenticatenaceae bacterium]